MHQRNPQEITHSKYSYDIFNHLTQEQSIQTNQFTYDSIGNYLKKNGHHFHINRLNQIEKTDQSKYTYDPNGNLVTQTNPPTNYTYDALNRLTTINTTTLLYDAFDRCIQMTNENGTTNFLYQRNKEIGTIQGEIKELRIVHPEKELTFAIELNHEPYFPIQDHCHNISAIQKKDGTLAQWYRYSAFGEKKQATTFYNPWCYANRREINNLILFTHRLYNPTLMRWMTPDPLGSIDAFNLYAYVRNNPFLYYDPEGEFSLALTLFELALPALTFNPVSFVLIAATIAGAYATYQGYKYLDNCLNQANIEEQEKLALNDKPKAQIQEEDDERKKASVRNKPKNLQEQLALEEAKANPKSKNEEIMKDKIRDPNYPASDWKKCEHVHRNPDGSNIDIHFWENRITGERTDFKFKDY